MRGFRLFERPLGVFAEVPALMVMGDLPPYTVAVPYEGRLDILNPIGRCKVEIVEEGTRLPPGATAHVDNFSQEVVLRWPAFSPPEEEKEGIVNWNFELGDLTGWKDLRGNSWDTYVYDITTDGVKDNPYLPAPGNIAARMTGAGRGDHILESDLYPVTPGAPISARSLWYQGPSNKDNNNLWTAIQFYSPGKVPLVNGEVRGDRIHDRTNKARHWSSVNTTVPAAAGWASVKLIAYRRNSRNRLINVDDVETSGFVYEEGTDDPLNLFTVHLKVTDSAGRIAYWQGVISSAEATLLTTSPYPVIVVEALQSSGQVYALDSYDHGYAEVVDSTSSSGSVLGLQLYVSQMNHEYGSGESLTAVGTVQSLSMETTTRYLTEGVIESASSDGRVQALSMSITTTYISHTTSPDGVTSGGQVTGVSMQ